MTLSPIRTGRAIIYPYFENQDLSASVSGPIVELDYPLRCLSFQGLVTGGAPQGTLKVQMSIIENVWTDLGACKPVSIDVGENTDFMILIPEQPMYAGKLRLTWTPSGGSGTLTVLRRDMPL